MRTNRKKYVILKPIHAIQIVVLFAVLALSGCTRPDWQDSLTIPQNWAPQPPVQRHLAGTSVEKRPIEYLIIGNGSDVVFFISGIHGDEKVGIPLVFRMITVLQQNPSYLDGKMVIILPIANPDGSVRSQRYNANGVDINRNFPADNRQNIARYGITALSEPESKIIYDLINKYKPARIITIHQPYACIDYDGPAELVAQSMTRYCDLPLKRVGALPGSLGSFAGVTSNIPIVTLELTDWDNWRSANSLWNRYGKSLLAAIVYPDNLK